jgi:hypothetical protein
MIPILTNLDKKSRTMVISFLLILIAAIIIGIIIDSALHGRIIINSDKDKINTISIFNQTAQKKLEPSKQTSFKLPTGTYIVRVDLINGTTYQKALEVKPFSINTINPRSDDLDVENIYSYADDYIIPTKGGEYLTYNTKDHWITVDPATAQNNADNTPRIILATGFTKDERPILFGITGAKYQAVIYDGINFSYEYISDNLYISPNFNAIMKTNGSITLAQQKKITVINEDGVQDFNLSKITAAQAGTSPIADVSNKTLVILSGNNYIDTSTSEGRNLYNYDELKESILNIYSTENLKLKQKINLGKRVDISRVSLSPSGDKVVVVGQFVADIYNISSGELLYSVTSDTQFNGGIFWENNDNFIFEGGLSAIYRADIKSKESYGIIKLNNINVTNITTIHECYLYLTGFDKSWKTKHNMPDGYRINICS